MLPWGNRVPKGAELNTNPSFDARLRVVAIALEPALALARMMALPLDDLQTLVECGLYRDAQNRNLSHRAMARRFDKSLRTIVSIAKQSRANESLAQPSRLLSVRRYLAERVPHKRGIDRQKLVQGLPPAARSLALEEIAYLVKENIFEENGQSVRSLVSYVDLPRGDMTERLEAVRHFLSIVGQLLQQKFFVPASSAPREAFARAFTFRATHQDLEELRNVIYQFIKERVQVADEQSPHAPMASLAFCVVEGPNE